MTRPRQGRLLPPPPADPDFERFWAAYPPRRGNPKAEAAAAFARIKREGGSVAAIIAAAERYAASLQAHGVDPMYIAHAVTWLRNRRWADWPAPAAPAATPGPAAVVASDDLDFWLAECTIEDTGAMVRITAPSAFKARWLRQRLDQALRQRWPGRTIEVLP